MRKFSKFCSDRFIATPIDMLCSNFVKFRVQENGEIVRFLPDKKQNFALWLSSSWYCADRVQNLPGPGLLKVLHISSKAVNFRRSYIESVNTIKTGPKVFPMFGRSIACSGIITDI